MYSDQVRDDVEGQEEEEGEEEEDGEDTACWGTGPTQRQR